MSETIDRLRASIGRVYLGNPTAIDRVLACLLAGGHVLIEDVPGVGKTVLASAVARSIRCDFARVQLTPDMLPSDVLGVSVFDQDKGTFDFKRGPVFTNILLADEINRTTPRTQTALLEAMSEASVSVDGVRHDLPPPFMVLATQNPYEFEGTYLLPENQLDRFLMRIELGYPDASIEAELLDTRPASSVLPELEPVASRDEVIGLQQATANVRVDESVRRYIIQIAHATREHPEIKVGLSPRGSLALAQAARAWAVLNGRDYVIPEDVLENVREVCAHRIFLAAGGHHDAWARTLTVLDEIVRALEAPA
ncbi:MAG: AAA family ATPase [Planctomycetota bacterium]